MPRLTGGGSLLYLNHRMWAGCRSELIVIEEPDRIPVNSKAHRSSEMPPETADLVIVGAGAAGTHTLLALLSRLSSVDVSRTRPLQIVVFERDSQFFSGIAYGRRSGRASLTLSPLKRFLPDEERALFLEWLASLGDEVAHHQDIDSDWLDRHRDDVNAGRWEHLAIPRRLYGEFLAHRACAAIRLARSNGVAEFAFVNAAVTSVHETNSGYLLRASDRDGQMSEIGAGAVVLAIGSPPVRRLEADSDALDDGLIQDIHHPGLDLTLERLGGRLAALPEKNRNVLVVGGNADALEFIVASHNVFQRLKARITVLSPAGRPRHWRRKNPSEVAELPALAAMKSKADEGKRVTAAGLYEAVASDLHAAVVSGTDIAAVPAIMEAIPYFLGLFDEEDRVALASAYGIPISNLLRHDCIDAIDILDRSVEIGAIDFQAGRYRGARYDGSYFEVTASDEGGRKWILEQRYAAVVDSSGFEKISTTRCPLIKQMLRDGIVDASSSDAGLRVDRSFCAAPRLFVVGPLLAGNAHENMLIWHAESVPRIIAIAQDAAQCIANEVGQLPPETLLKQ